MKELFGSAVNINDGLVLYSHIENFLAVKNSQNIHLLCNLGQLIVLFDVTE